MCEKAIISKGGTIRLDVNLVMAALGEREKLSGKRTAKEELDGREGTDLGD